jgi:hypothetical protein
VAVSLPVEVRIDKASASRQRSIQRCRILAAAISGAAQLRLRERSAPDQRTLAQNVV